MTLIQNMILIFFYKIRETMFFLYFFSSQARLLIVFIEIHLNKLINIFGVLFNKYNWIFYFVFLIKL
jgi:hypothetical protein